jgi:adenosyl cobinamide kinase/adenosyl cobinamide phosphate guanylyltransferase
MLDALKTLFENNVISEEIKASIESAWEARIIENKEQVAQQLREEFAQKYEHDKQTMIEAVDRMITDQLSQELVEFADDRKQLAEMKARYAVKMKEHTDTVAKFVTNQLASEVKELHEDQVAMAEKFGTLEKFVVEALAEEIAEFYKDKQDLAETKVRLVREGREQLGKVKQQFV